MAMTSSSRISSVIVCCILITVQVILISGKNLSGSNRKRCLTEDEVIPLADIKAAVAVSKGVYTKDFNQAPEGFAYKKTILVGSPDAGYQFKVVICESPTAKIIGFRGTSDQIEEQMKKLFARGMKKKGNFQLIRQGLSFLTAPLGTEFKIAGQKTKVNDFFLQAFQNFLEKDITEELQDPEKKYILTGHSLGGALASLLGIYMTDQFDNSAWKNPLSSLITFGQPRVGDDNFAELHDKLIEPRRKLRFVYRKDGVPHIPPKKLFKHHLREIYLDDFPVEGKNSSGWKFCPKPESSECSAKHGLSLSASDHNIAEYEQRIVNEPEVFFNTSDEKKQTYIEAMTTSCKKKKKQSKQQGRKVVRKSF